MSALRAFPLPSRAPTWYIGHMAKSMREFPALLRDIDIVIEARDARVPLSGVNGGLEGMVRRSWGLPGTGYGFGTGSGSAGRMGVSTWGGGKGEIEAGPSSEGSSAGAMEVGIGVGVDKKGKGKAREREREWEREWTEEEREERLAQIQRQGGRMRERVVVYTKRDLAEERFEEPLKSAFWEHARQRVFFANTDVDRDVKEVMRYIIELARRHTSLTGNTAAPINILVVGMPNVGKSSLLNALRRIGVKKGKAFRTSAKPGHTRKLTGTVRIHDDPLVYVYDAPGVMVPFLGRGEEGVEKGLKLALTSGIKEGLIPEETVAEYLLHLFNTYHYPEIFLSDPATLDPGTATSPISPFKGDISTGPTNPSPSAETIPLSTPKQRSRKTYLHHLNLPTFTPTDSLLDFLTALAKRLGALKRGGEVDVDHAQTFFLRMFREGKLGRLTVDDLGRLGTRVGGGGASVRQTGDLGEDVERIGLRGEGGGVETVPAGVEGDALQASDGTHAAVSPREEMIFDIDAVRKATELEETPTKSAMANMNDGEQTPSQLAEPHPATPKPTSDASPFASQPTSEARHTRSITDDLDTRVRNAFQTFLASQAKAIEAAASYDTSTAGRSSRSGKSIRSRPSGTPARGSGVPQYDMDQMSDTQRNKREAERIKAERKDYKARKQAGSAGGGTGAGGAGRAGAGWAGGGRAGPNARLSRGGKR